MSRWSNRSTSGYCRVIMPNSDLQTFELVSICIPVFNCEDTVEAAVLSLVNQDYPNIEVLISDNGSTDKTAQICEDIQAKNNTVKIYRFSENQGVSENYKQVVRMATGKFIVFGAGDDSWDPAFVRKTLLTLKASQSSVVCMCSVQRQDPDHNPIDILRFDKKGSPQFQTPLDLMREILLKRNQKGDLVKNNLFIHGIFKVEAISDAILNLGFERTNERDTLCRVVLYGNFCHLNEVLFAKTIQRESFTSRNPEDIYSKVKSSRDTIAYSLKTCFGFMRANQAIFSRQLLAFPLFIILVKARIKWLVKHRGYAFMQAYIPDRFHPFIRFVTGKKK
jgi:glycosyltransferase involved in cell wall biosynthesis